MRLLLLLLFTASTLGSFGQAIEIYTDSIEKERNEKLELLKSKHDSPLQKIDRKKLKELSFYPVDIHANVDALYFLIQDGEKVDFATSNGASKTFQKAGYFIFSYRGKTDTLYAYQRVYPDGYESDHEPYLFVPFKDETSGFETYGGGRYLDTEVYKENQKVSLDFNRCYNPYCAYGDGFSCPIPPEENYINMKMEAGEKTLVHESK